MKYPIVSVTTQDKYVFHGLLSKPKKQTDRIIIHIHGSGGNFYYNDFYSYISNAVNEENYAFLQTNNRSTGVYEIETGSKPTGSAIEIFEKCLLDIDAWIKFAFSKGYKNIILEGHSFGTNKVQYYILNGKYQKEIRALILLGFTDSYGGQLEYLKKIGINNYDILKEAEELIKQGKPNQLLSNLNINWGELPQTAQSYKNLMSPGSELSKILPLQNNLLPNFRKISVPILGIVGDTNECTVIPPKEAVNLLNKENQYAQCYMITHCSHGYKGKETEVANKIKFFLKNLDI